MCLKKKCAVVIVIKEGGGGDSTKYHKCRIFLLFDSNVNF